MRAALERYALSRDPDAFRELVQEFQSMVYGTCRRILGDRPEVDDAVQETFIRFARKAHAIRADNPAGWLHACARSSALNVLQAEGPRKRREVAMATSDPKASAASEHVERRDEAEAVDACIDELPETDREVVVSYFFVEESQEKIAARLGVSQGTIHRRLEQAMEVLRRKLVRRGVAVTGAFAAFMHNAAAQTEIPAALAARLSQITTVGSRHSRSLAAAKGGVSAIKFTAAFACVVLSLGAAAWLTWQQAAAAEKSELIKRWDFTGPIAISPAPEDDFQPVQSGWARSTAPLGGMRNTGNRPLVFALPFATKRQPMMVRAKLRFTTFEASFNGSFDVLWSPNGKSLSPIRSWWTSKLHPVLNGSEFEAIAYCFDRSCVYMYNDTIRSMILFDDAYPADRLLLVIEGFEVLSLEASYVRSDAIPAAIRDPAKVISAGGLEERPDLKRQP